MSPKQKSRRALVLIAVALLILGIPLDFFVLRKVGLQNIRLFPTDHNFYQRIRQQNERIVRSMYPLDSTVAGSNRILNEDNDRYLSLIVFGKPSQKDSSAYLVLLKASGEDKIETISVEPSGLNPDVSQLSQMRKRRN